jgi:hypothetical protein
VKVLAGSKGVNECGVLAELCEDPQFYLRVIRRNDPPAWRSVEQVAPFLVMWNLLSVRILTCESSGFGPKLEKSGWIRPVTG